MMYLLERFKESSSWAGLSGLAAAIGLSSDEYMVYANVAAALCGLAAFLMRDRTPAA